ncbi:MAG TPA: hypothetical protein VGM25_14925 [Caulobacteraceae bacterium]|jgi:hypothetical protein
MPGVKRLLAALACASAICAPLAAMAQEDHPLSLGHVEFVSSASGQAQSDFINGLLALHSVWYDKAREYFVQAEKDDPSFGMAYWGEAMTYDNAFQVEPDLEGQERQGVMAVTRLNQLDGAGKLRWNPLEKGFAEAVKVRFQANEDLDTRRDGYAAAMAELSAKYPNDDEVTTFTALAVMALSRFDNNDARDVVSVAARLEEVFQHNPHHPGALLYLIQLYATPTFALMGKRQAVIYAQIAPPDVHALHMPSHIFRILNMWPEVERSNQDAWRVAVERQQKAGGPFRTRDIHALTWLIDAELNLGRFEDARKTIAGLDALAAANKGPDWDQFRQVVTVLKGNYSQTAPKPQ